MNIGICANSLTDPKRTGIGRYTFALLSELFHSHPEQTYYIYTALPVVPDLKAKLPSSPNIIFRESNFPIRYLWQIFYCGFRLNKDPLDVFLSLDGIIPLGCRVPCAGVVHDLIWHHHPKTAAPHIYWIYRTNLYRSLKRMNHCILDSLATARDVQQVYRIPENKISVVCAGIDESHFHTVSPSDHQPILESLNIRQPYVFYIGNLMPHKNVSGLIHALKLLKNQYTALKLKPPQLVIAGCRTIRSNPIFQLVRDHKLEDDILFLGYIEDEHLNALYSGARMFVFPTLMEGFGLPLLEAQACGTPVVCSNATSLPEIAGDSALMCDPYDPNSIARQIRRLLEDDRLHADMVERGFRNVKRFTWQQTAAGIMDVLNRVAATGAKG